MFHLLRLLFKVHLSKIVIDESETFCWKHEIFLFQKLNRVIYIFCCVSASQYKSGKNTDIYVHIVSS